MVVLTYIFSINIVAHPVNKKARHYTRLFCIIYNLFYRQNLRFSNDNILV